MKICKPCKTYKLLCSTHMRGRENPWNAHLQHTPDSSQQQNGGRNYVSKNTRCLQLLLTGTRVSNRLRKVFRLGRRKQPECLKEEEVSASPLQFRLLPPPLPPFPSKTFFNQVPLSIALNLEIRSNLVKKKTFFVFFKYT